MKLSDGAHKKFRQEIRKMRGHTHFDRKRRAFYRWQTGGKKTYLRGVHRTVARVFGSLGSLISHAGGSEGNETRSKTRTSRGSRIGKELCSLAASRVVPKKAHTWTRMLVKALRQWHMYPIDGEVPVSRGHIGTGIDLLCVTPDEDQVTWRLVCVEIKTGYKGAVWAKSQGHTKRIASGCPTLVKSIRNYALMQLQLTHECAKASLSKLEFAPPILLLVNDLGVRKSTPPTRIRDVVRAHRFF